LVGIERLQRALRVITASSRVKNGMGALSANLIAPSDSGKTQLMLGSLPKNSRVLNDVTTITLMRILREPVRPEYLVIPDLNTVISHKPAVAELTMAMLLSLMAEGVTELNPGLESEVKIKMSRAKAVGIRIAILTGMTPEMFMGKRGKWRATGLLRRLLPIYYSYTRETQDRIQTAITQDDRLNYHHSHVNGGTGAARVVSVPEHMNEHFRRLSEYIARDQLVWKTQARDGRQYVARPHEYPFSVHKVVRQLARSAAALRGDTEVQQCDLQEVENVCAFMRYDSPEKL
jgi:hypothetical protein